MATTSGDRPSPENWLAALEQRHCPETLADLVGGLHQLLPLLDAMPDVVFFVKDTEARYVLANATLARRCGFGDTAKLLGHTAAEVFPARFGPVYTAQDRKVLREGMSLSDQLELHLYPGREPGWCLTHKLALRNRDDRVIGMAGISHDLQAPQSRHPAYQRIAAVDEHIRIHYAEPIKLATLTAIAGLSIAQLERMCKRIFRLTPRQMLHKARLDAASQLLLAPLELPITEIALRCGYTDHSAFSRQFKALTGLSPSVYRARKARNLLDNATAPSQTKPADEIWTSARNP